MCRFFLFREKSVAGIIAAKNNNVGVVGVAAGAKVVPVKVSHNDDRGGRCSSRSSAPRAVSDK